MANLTKSNYFEISPQQNGQLSLIRLIIVHLLNPHGIRWIVRWHGRHHIAQSLTILPLLKGQVSSVQNPLIHGDPSKLLMK